MHCCLPTSKSLIIIKRTHKQKVKMLIFPGYISWFVNITFPCIVCKLILGYDYNSNNCHFQPACHCFFSNTTPPIERKRSKLYRKKVILINFTIRALISLHLLACPALCYRLLKPAYVYKIHTRNTCMQKPLALISKHCFNMKYSE